MGMGEPLDSYAAVSVLFWHRLSFVFMGMGESVYLRLPSTFVCRSPGSCVQSALRMMLDDRLFAPAARRVSVLTAAPVRVCRARCA